LYDLAVQTTAVKGWSIADLASKSGVARSTIYGWRDHAGKPTAKAVNAVADVLGIPRERALRAAGIIPGIKPEPNAAIPKKLLRDIMESEDLTDDERLAVIAAIDNTLAKERGESAAAGSAPAPAPAAEPDSIRPAS
jgi:transcriptional regulator with XRE-family HTH domain